ncbi:MAG: T9SS type A sorting domain-containing protein [Cyclonatronaceae bacterium]
MNSFVVRIMVIMLALTGFASPEASGQDHPFDFNLALKPVEIPELPGVHSYAYGQHDGKWLIIGGRIDGLHARRPFESFPASHNNTSIFVIDIANRKFKSASLESLSTGMREQLQSTNLNFHQQADTLYIIGGYAYSDSLDLYVTFPNLTTVLVPEVIEAIEEGRDFADHIKQTSNDIFAVTGGQLGRIGDTFYLVGGHRFDGRYNPANGPSFTQTYTNSIRKFRIHNTGDVPVYLDYAEITDTVHLHRRDFNLVPNILPDGSDGYLISSGVFQQGVDLPFLHPVEIGSAGYNPIPDVNQYLSNYHSPKLALYDGQQDAVHMLFFGGLAQYYYSEGELVRDDLVPFVRTISRLSRNSNGIYAEYVLPVEMPALKGTSAEFIPNKMLPSSPTGVFLLDDIPGNDIPGDDIVLGHIFGGIESPTLNPFANSLTTTTYADPSIFEISLQRGQGTSIRVNDEIPAEFRLLQNFPNPFNPSTGIVVELPYPAPVHIGVFDITGRRIRVITDGRMMDAGRHILHFDASGLSSGIYLYSLTSGSIHITKKMALIR